MRTKADYYALQAEIDSIAEKHGFHYELTDACVDAENACPLTERDGDAYWDRMYSSMCSAAGFRAEERGLNINKLLGRSIY
jgi:hypothetical protein